MAVPSWWRLKDTGCIHTSVNETWTACIPSIWLRWRKGLVWMIVLFKEGFRLCPSLGPFLRAAMRWRKDSPCFNLRDIAFITMNFIHDINFFVTKEWVHSVDSACQERMVSLFIVMSICFICMNIVMLLAFKSFTHYFLQLLFLSFQSWIQLWCFYSSILTNHYSNIRKVSLPLSYLIFFFLTWISF